MNPIYRFILTTDNDAQVAFPIYKDDLSLDYALEQGEQFYRGKLSGQLTFIADDYSFIVGKPFDTRFRIEVQISYSNGDSWASYWKGKFWKTDCTFDADAKSVVVTPSLSDRYDKVLEGMDKEFDLIPLAPALASIKFDKRPMIQVYVAGASTIGCFLSGMWWEQECEAESTHNTLVNTYHFARNVIQNLVEVSGDTQPKLPAYFTGEGSNGAEWEYTSGGYTVRFFFNASTQVSYWYIYEEGGETNLWAGQQGGLPTAPYTVELQPVSAGVLGTVTLTVRSISVYARYITDVETAGTYEIPSNDIVPDNRNYSRVTPYNAPNNIYLSDRKTETPTQWGLYQPGIYYAYPAAPSLGIPDAFPVSRDTWGVLSVWFSRPSSDYLAEVQWRKESTLKNTFPLWSVISVLLGQIDPEVTHAESTLYSQFLYGALDPVLGGTGHRLYIVPKSNVINSSFDQPAQKAPITLRQVLDMLRDCYRVFWFIDDDGRFCLEHISWFMRGGSYSDSPEVGIDLTSQKVTRNGKSWDFGRNQYSFEKPDMPARYQFGWMDSVTKLFKGFPIDILSEYVQAENIEDISVNSFTSDIDYIVLNPSEISSDGFALLSVDAGADKLPYVQYTVDGIDYELQNGKASFNYLQQYYLYDLPAPRYSINGVQGGAYGTKKLKTQTLNFPVLTDPNFRKLVKTNLGRGIIEKMVITLLSRNANTTLHYDTE